MKPLIGAGGPASRATDSEEALIARLSTLAPALDGEPDPEWQSRTRARLVAMAAVRMPEPEPVSPVRRLLARHEGRPPAWRTRLTAGLAGAAAAVTGLAAVVSLSANAQPGDPLYGLKRGTEQTQLALAGDARGRTLLGFASTRLEELSLVLPDGADAEVVDETLATMDAQTVDGAAWLTRRALDTGTSTPLDELSGWSAGQAAGLADVRTAMPADAEDDAGVSADLLARIDERVDALRVALDCPTGPATDGSDELGPVPAACAAPAPPAAGAGPDVPVTDLPGTPATPSPGSPADGTTAPDGGSGSGSDGDAGTPGSGSGSGPGSGEPDLPGLPGEDLGTPDLPGGPLPSLPPLIPSPGGETRPPTAGTQSGSSSSSSSSPSSSSSGPVTGPDTGLGLDVCLPPLPAIGDC